jgi:hypothetical protein
MRMVLGNRHAAKLLALYRRNAAANRTPQEQHRPGARDGRLTAERMMRALRAQAFMLRIRASDGVWFA